MTPAMALLATVLWTGGAAAQAESPCFELACTASLRRGGSAENYWDRWKASTTQVMSGARASTLYRDTANRMSAWWRLYEFDRERPWLDEQDAARARELAEIGAVAGLEQMLRDTFERHETLGVLYRIGSTASGANVELTRRADGTKVRYNARSAQLRAAEADIDEDRPRRARTRAAPKPSARTGVAFNIVDINDDENDIDPELALVAYIDLRRIGVDALRLQAADTRPGSKIKGKGSWSATVRQGVVGDLDAFAKLNGRENREWRPARVAGGLTLALPTESSWNLRGEVSRRFADVDLTGVESPAESRVMLLLQARLRWHLPQAHDRWPLGQDVDPDDPALADFAAR